MSIYATGFTRHIRKHIKDDLAFVQTPSHISDKEIKYRAETHTPLADNITMYVETQAWLKRYYVYVADLDQYMFYNINTGLWDTDAKPDKLRNLLNDYYTILNEEARKSQDMIMSHYARAMFKPVKLNELIGKIQKATFFTKPKYNKILEETEDLVLFDTISGKQALMDLSKDQWNLSLVKLADTQPMMLTKKQTKPIAENPRDTPTLFLSLIETYMMNDPELIEYFHKVLAYMMSPYNYNQVVLHFYGPKGKNGKSTIVKVLQDILGPRTARISNQFLADRPDMNFKIDDALAAINGKSLIIFNEIKERMLLNTETFKKLGDGGRDNSGNKTYETIRPAFRAHYDVCVQGIPVILSNNFLTFPDWADTAPIHRRLVIVPFDYTIGTEDSTIPDRLAAEYPQIQLWLYQNYFKHVKLGKLNIKDDIATPKPKRVLEIRAQYESETDTLGTFFKDCFIADPNSSDRILKSDLYRTYQTYCKHNGRMAMGNTGTSGFQTLIKPYLTEALGDNYEMSSNGSIYVKGLTHSPQFLKEMGV